MLLSAEVLVVVSVASDADGGGGGDDDDDASSTFDDGREPLFTKADTNTPGNGPMPDALAASTSSSLDAVQIEIIVEAIAKWRGWSRMAVKNEGHFDPRRDDDIRKRHA